MAKSQLFGRRSRARSSATAACSRSAAAHQDEEAFISAFKILERGGAVGMYCEGGRSRNGRGRRRGRPGIGRLALESGAPVVPVAILGSHQVRNWKRLQFPKVTVQLRRAVALRRRREPTREQQQEAADVILERIRALHDELERLGPMERRAYARAPAGVTYALSLLREQPLDGREIAVAGAVRASGRTALAGAGAGVHDLPSDLRRGSRGRLGSGAGAAALADRRRAPGVFGPAAPMRCAPRSSERGAPSARSPPER